MNIAKKGDIDMEGNIELENKITILVVEDEEINFLYIEEILSELDIKLLHAKNGSETLSIAKEKKDIDLVLMDIKLPDTNGYVLTKQLKELLPGVPIVAQTAYAMSGDRNKAISAGCIDYLPKPIAQEDLIEIIKNYTKLKT